MSDFVEPHRPAYQVMEMSDHNIDKWEKLERFDNPTDAEDYAEKIQDDKREIQIVRIVRFNY